jgi:hypothetical protein
MDYESYGMRGARPESGFGTTRPEKSPLLFGSAIFRGGGQEGNRTLAGRTAWLEEPPPLPLLQPKTELPIITKNSSAPSSLLSSALFHSVSHVGRTTSLRTQNTKENTYKILVIVHYSDDVSWAEGKTRRRSSVGIRTECHPRILQHRQLPLAMVEGDFMTSDFLDRTNASSESKLSSIINHHHLQPTTGNQQHNSLSTQNLKYKL